MYFYRSVHFRIGSPARWSSVFLFLLLQAETLVLVRMLQQVTEHQEQIWMWKVTDLNKAAFKGDHFGKLRAKPASAFIRVFERAGNSLSCCHLLVVVCLRVCVSERCHKAKRIRVGGMNCTVLKGLHFKQINFKTNNKCDFNFKRCLWLFTDMTYLIKKAHNSCLLAVMTTRGR